MKYLKIAILASAVGVFAAACAQTANTPNATNTAAVNKTAANTAASPAPTAAAADEMAAARQTFATICANCHKDDGTGGEVEIEGKTLDAEDLTSDKIKAFSDDKIAGYIRNGVPGEGMPAFKDRLNDQQIKDLVRFIRVEIQKTEPKPAG